MATSPPIIAAVPVFPPVTDRANYNTKVYTFNEHIRAVFGPSMAALGANVYTNALAAEGSADIATVKAQVAQDAATTAAGATNFKGNWSDLTGALPRPACVKHSGRFWLLLSDLGDVTAATPGVSSAWTVMDVGAMPSQQISVSTTAVVGVRYLLLANDITLTAPTVVAKGDYFGFREAAGLTGAIVDFGATKLRGGTPGAMTIDAAHAGLDLYFEDVTRGYC